MQALGEKNMEALIGIIATLVGVVIGGGITLLSNKLRIDHEEKLEKGKRMLGKLEEAHEHLTTISLIYRSMYGNHIALLISNHKMEDKQSKRIPFEELDMLISFYSPTLVLDAKNLIKACQSYGSTSVDVELHTPKSKEDRNALLEIVNEKYNLVDKATNDLKEKISAIAQIHAH